jgi:hypothetical protein
MLMPTGENGGDEHISIDIYALRAKEKLNLNCFSMFYVV